MLYNLSSELSPTSSTITWTTLIPTLAPQTPLCGDTKLCIISRTCSECLCLNRCYSLSLECYSHRKHFLMSSFKIQQKHRVLGKTFPKPLFSPWTVICSLSLFSQYFVRICIITTFRFCTKLPAWLLYTYQCSTCTLFPRGAFLHSLGQAKSPSILQYMLVSHFKALTLI